MKDFSDINKKTFSSRMLTLAPGALDDRDDGKVHLNAVSGLVDL